MRSKVLELFVVNSDKLLSVAEMAVKSLFPLFVHDLMFEDDHKNATDKDDSMGEYHKCHRWLPQDERRLCGFSGGPYDEKPPCNQVLDIWNSNLRNTCHFGPSNLQESYLYALCCRWIHLCCFRRVPSTKLSPHSEHECDLMPRWDFRCLSPKYCFRHKHQGSWITLQGRTVS